MSDWVEGRIKEGARIFQDMAFCEWPVCKPPRSEFNEDEEYEYRTKYPDRTFLMRWTGGYWNCFADGYGFNVNGAPKGNYGNGSIIVRNEDDVIIYDRTPPTLAKQGDE